MAVDNNETEVAAAPEKHPLAGTGEDVTPNKDGGILKAIVKDGDAAEEDRPMKGDTVYVHYVGTLTSGEEFDSSRRRDNQFSFKLGEGQVIKAWDMGVATMRRGEVAVLTCRPEYAYGKNGQGKIPPDATLIFEVELFHWTGEDLTEAKDGGIVRRVIKEGKGMDKPAEETTLQVRLVGKHGSTVFDEREVTVIIGEVSDSTLPEALQRGLKEMVEGETSQIILQPKYGFGRQGCPELNVPADATLKYEVTVLSLEKAKESWEMDPEEKLTAAETAKSKGTECFKAGNFKGAIKQYKKIMDFLDSTSDFSEEQNVTCRSILLPGHLNLAMAYIKNQEHLLAIESCDKALEMDADNIKGLFRRGQANLALAEFVPAKADFRRAAELDPGNKAAQNQVAVCAHKIKQASLKEKRLYGNMFQKFAEQDRKAEESKRVISTPPEDFGAVFNKEDIQGSNGDQAEIPGPEGQTESSSAGDQEKAPGENAEPMEV